MKITYYANLMLLLEGRKTRVLCDPWVTFNNFSRTNMYNFPKTNITKKQVINLKPDFIYVTHAHVDHFDPLTLSLFNKNIPIIVADYKVNFLAKSIASLGFKNIKVIPKDKGLKLNNYGDHVWVEPAAEASDVDSIALFRMDKFRILNANDNIFDFKQCNKFKKKLDGIDIGLLPSGAHGPWPMFFDEVTTVKMMWARQRKKRLLEIFRKYINATKPKWVIPVAGGLMCSGQRAKQYKYSGISPRSEGIEYALKYEKFIPILLSSKTSYDFKKEKYNGRYQEATLENQKKYIDELSKIPEQFSKEGLFFIDQTQRISDLSYLLNIARKTQAKWQKKLGYSSLNHTIFFDIGQNFLYKLSFKKNFIEKIDRKEKIKEKKFEIFKMAYELLLGVITRHYFWDNISTNHVYFKRKNCKLNREALLLMNYFNI